MEGLESCLKNTPFESLIQELYFGCINNTLTCTECAQPRKTEQSFLEIMLEVQEYLMDMSTKQINSVSDSLDKYFAQEELDGVNCELCQKPTLHNRGPLISKLPPILTFNLNRLAIDMTTFDRKKVNTRFEYPLELDMSKYLDQSPETPAHEQAKDPDQYTYELKSIVIHSGGPYGGHYYAYIKDDLKEGNWDVQMPEKFHEKPTEVDDRPAHVK